MAEEKRVLGLIDLFGIAVGLVIGVGVMTMTGIAIGMTGRSVNIAFLFAAVLSLISSIPPLLIGSTANFAGGQYSQIAILSGKKAAGTFIYLNIAMTLASVLTSLSLAQYVASIVPGINQRLVAVVVIAGLVLMHTVSVKGASGMQNILVFVLVIALGLYIAFGLGNIRPNYFGGEGFLTNGPFGLARASMYLTMSLGGATYVVNYSSKAKNPVRDVPIVIIVTTIGVAILYTLIGTVAAGVLPVEEVANQPLSIAAEHFMPKSIFLFFVVGGAIFSLATTLNAGIGNKVYPLQSASRDGWLPEIFGKSSKKFGTPIYALLLTFLITAIPIIFGIDIRTVANSTVIIVTCIRILMAFAAINLPKTIPELWGKSKFYMSDSKLKFFCFLSALVNSASVVMLIFTQSKERIIGNIVLLIICGAFAFIMEKKANINASYTEV